MKQDEAVFSTNMAFVLEHREDDVRALALRKMPAEVDAAWCLQQIEGWQLARQKLPKWAATPGICFPPRISMEQCSSQLAAEYKRRLVERLTLASGRRAMVDLTGGFGVDFSFLASLFDQATYVERQSLLCEIARHNFAELGLGRVCVCCDEATQFLGSMPLVNLIYLDPARRDGVGRKVVAIEDCTPNLVELQEELLSRCQWLVVKLSPMLDVVQALRKLRGVREVHVVSVQGECKELLLVIQPDADSNKVDYYCTNIVSEGATMESCYMVASEELHAICVKELCADQVGEGSYLYEPNASILKAGVQDTLPQRLGVKKLHPQSNLFVSDTPISSFPGRAFRILSVSDFSKKCLKELLQDLTKANLTIRNFPSTVAQLRKQLKLKEGGDVYLFATTLFDGRHVMIKTEKLTSV